MATYVVDDDGTGDYTTLAGALAVAGAGDVILVEATHDEVSSASDFDIVLKASSPSYDIIRVDRSDSNSYDTTTATNNFQTTTGNYEIDINGGASWYGIRFQSNEHIALANDSDARQEYRDCHFEVGVGDYFGLGANLEIINATITTKDTANSNTDLVYLAADAGLVRLVNCTFSTGCSYRSIVVDAGSNTGSIDLIGCDLSVFTRNPTYLAYAQNRSGIIRYIDCKLPPNYTVFSGTNDTVKRVELVRCNGTDEIEAHTEAGSMINEDTIKRDSGSSNSLEVVTTAYCGMSNPIYTNWIYALVDAAESKTFDIHFTCDTDLDDEEIFMELEFLDSATTPYGTMVTSKTTGGKGDETPASHTSTTGEWTSGKAYQKRIRITQTPAVADTLCRARVGIQYTSLSNECYIDNMLVIS